MSALLQIVQEHLRASATSLAPPSAAPTPAAPTETPSRRRRATSSPPSANADGARPPAATRPARKPGPRPAERMLANASEQARRVAAVILDVLAGTRSTSEAATALQISAARYYQIETRALAGLVDQCAPAERPRGRLANPATALAKLERENRRLRQDLQRAQALARISQRSLGLTAPKERSPARPDGRPGRKRRRPTVRAMRAAERLRPSNGAADAGSPQSATPTADQRGG